MRTLLVLLALPMLAVTAQEEGPPADLVPRLASEDGLEQMDAIAEAATSGHHSLVAPLSKLLREKETGIRKAAIDALGRQNETGGKKKAAVALAPRLKPLSAKEEDREELKAVVDALHDLAQTASIKALLDVPATEDDREMLRARARAVGNVPHADAIEALIQFSSLGRKGSWRREVARDALSYATNTKNERYDTDEWRRWWTDNKKEFDFTAAAEARAQSRAETAAKEQEREARKEKQSKNQKEKRGGKPREE